MSFNLEDYKFDFSAEVPADSGFGLGGSGISKPSSTDTGGFFTGVKDLFSELGGLYVQSKMLEKLNPNAYSNYAWQNAGGNSNGAITQPFNTVVAQQQQMQAEAAMQNKGTTQLILIGGAALVLFLVLSK